MRLKNFNITKSTLTHPWHIVDMSPWPIITSGIVINLILVLVSYLHFEIYSGWLLILFLLLLLGVLVSWWYIVIYEATFEGKHTIPTQKNLKLGFALFIVSEIMFFFGFFWAFYHNALAPAVQLGCIWPPEGIKSINAFEIPLLNTCILLISGATLTTAHHYLYNNNTLKLNLMFELTLILAIWFTLEQFFEYMFASFNISDGVYGSIFYMTTGFHGIHVIIGTIFISVSYYRYILNHFTQTHHIGFEASIWYWHFVDVVWLFLYIMIYWWGSII
jgi:cytochrome c oxidase subunit 3